MALPAPPPPPAAPPGAPPRENAQAPRPLAALAAAALGGGLWLGTDPSWGLVTLVATAATLGWVCRRHRLMAGVALALLAAAGWHAAGIPVPPLPDAVATATALRGRIVADPRPTPAGPRLTVALDGWRDAAGWQPASGRLLLGVRGAPWPPPARGDAVVFRGPLRSPQGFRNPGSAGYAAYLRRKQIVARASARWPGAVLFAAPAEGEAPVLAWRRRAAGAISAAAPGPGGAVLRALALGDRAGLSADTVEAFRRTGTSHVLAISGLHLGILGLLLVPALRRLLGWIPGLALGRPVAPLAHLLAVPPLLGYAALSGWQTSTLRALAMAALLLAGAALSRPVSPAGLLAGSALALALWQPAVLADPGFQLSLTALAGLFWLAPAALARFYRPPDPLQQLLSRTATAGGRECLAGAARRGGRYLTRGIVYSAAAAVATTPLAIYHFGAGSLAGTVVSPAVIAILGFGCLPVTLVGLLLHPVLPGASALLWRGAGDAAAATLAVLERIAPHAPQVAWPVLRTPTGLVGAAALLAAAALALRPRPPLRRAVLVALTGVACLVIPTTIATWRATQDSALHLWALDVGQGQAIALKAPGAHWALVDGGGFPASSFDVGARVVVPALKQLGTGQLDLVISTHPHPDHLGGLASAVRWGRPRQVWLPGSFAADPRYDLLLAAAQETGARVLWVGPDGHNGTLGALPLVARWFPARGENDRSMTVRVGAGEATVLIAADLEKAGQRRLLASAFTPRCSVLVAPHHGAASSLFPPFLRAAAPAAVVISAAGRHSLPAPEFLAAARRTGAAVYGTYATGCLHVTLGAGHAPQVAVAAR